MKLVQPDSHSGRSSLSVGRWLLATRVWWLRWKGWKTEGPFPPPHAEKALLIVGPDLVPGSDAVILMESRLRHKTKWVEDTAALAATWAAASPQKKGWRPSTHKFLISCSNPALFEVLALCHQVGATAQLVSTSRQDRRVRCNTPFFPSRHTRRECAYIHRVFSYYV